MPSATDTRSSAVPRVVFGLLVLATIAAFFVAQRVKRGDPVVRNISMPVYVSPNGDHRKDRAPIRFRLPKADHVTVSMVNSDGDEVRRLADRRLKRGKHHLVWNGRDGSGAVPPDGFYYLRVVLQGQNRGTITRRGIRLVTKPPKAQLTSVTPARIAAGRRTATPVTIRFDGPANPPPIFSVYRTDLPGGAKRVVRFRGERFRATGTWDGRVDGKPAPAGTYAFAVTVRNRAYVRGSSPRRLPPTAATAAPKTGLTIAGPAAAPPLEPVRAGRVVRVGLTGAGARGRVRWSVTALGARKPLRRGAAPAAPAIRVGIPSRAQTGLYTVRLTTRSGATTVPLAVRGRTTGRVLVVLPAITWQGLNPVDDDADGFPDTLDNARSVPAQRALASGRLPAGLKSDTVPLLRFLDARRLRYDLTTDLALARGHGPKLGGRPGVLFAGSERWFTEPLDRELREYVEGGGRAASFGSDAFRRTVEVTGTALASPSRPQETNALGEQTTAVESAAAPLVVEQDELGLFANTDNFVGLFTRFEESEELVRGSTAQTSAGRDKPAFVAYPLGDGTVVRVGTPQWGAALASADPEVQNVTEAVWSLLSR